MRSKQFTIPSEFIKLDTNVTAADSSVNVHDQHVFRQNHNALLAKRVRKDLISQVCSNESREYWFLFSLQPPDLDTGSRVLSIPLYLTQATRQIRFWCRCGQSGLSVGSELSEDPKIYAVLHEPQVAPISDVDTNAITVTTAYPNVGSYNADLAVPRPVGEITTHMGRIPYILDIYIKSFIDDTNEILGPGQAIIDSGSDWVTMASMLSLTNNAIYTNAAAGEPRLVIANKATTLGVDQRFWLDRPWSEVPAISNTVTVREILGVDMYSFGVQELPREDFTTEYHL